MKNPHGPEAIKQCSFRYEMVVPQIQKTTNKKEKKGAHETAVG